MPLTLNKEASVVEFTPLKKFNIYNAADLYDLPKICSACLSSVEEKVCTTGSSTLYATVSASTFHPVWSWLLLTKPTFVSLATCSHENRGNFLYKMPLWIKPVFTVGHEERERIQSYIYLDTCSKSKDASEVAETLIALKSASSKYIIETINTKYGPIINY